MGETVFTTVMVFLEKDPKTEVVRYDVFGTRHGSAIPVAQDFSLRPRRIGNSLSIA